MEDPGIGSSRAAESEHTWTWVVKKCSNQLNASAGTKVVSPPFAIGKYKFEFWWYPGGADSQTQEYVGVALKFRGPGSALINFSIHMGYDTIKMFKMTKCAKTFDSNTENSSYSGDYRLVERKILLDQVLRSSNDELMIKCVIYGLDIPESHGRFRILDNYERFLDSEKLSDVKIVVGKKIINAHKLVLVNGSEVFAAMFEHDMSENEEGIVNIDDIDYGVMVEIVRYMYTGKVERIVHKTKELLVAADKYDLVELKISCGKCLCMDLSPSNIFDYINFAHKYDVDDLKIAAESYFTSHAKEIVLLPNFKELLGTIDTDLTAKLIEGLAKQLK